MLIEFINEDGDIVQASKLNPVPTAGGGGMNAEDFKATAPLSWDSETETLTIDLSGYATAAQGDKADSAIQPGDIGTAAEKNTGYFATAAQGSKADSAVQPADLSPYAKTADLALSGALVAEHTNDADDTSLTTLAGSVDALRAALVSAG